MTVYRVPINTGAAHRIHGLVYDNGTSGVAAANSLKLNEKFEKAGVKAPPGASYGFDRGILRIFGVDAGYLCHAGFTVGQSPDINRAGTSGQRVAVCGGVFATGGGISTGLGFQGTYNKTANVLQLVYVGDKDARQAGMTYVGYGWLFGAMEHVGANVNNHGELAGADWSPIGMRIKSLQTSGVTDGKSFFGPMSFRAFDDGIYIEAPSESGQDENAGHCDNLFWGWLQFEYCTDCVHVNRNQALGFYVGGGISGAGVTNVFYFQDGGGLTVGDWHVNGSGQTILKIGSSWDANFRRYKFTNLEIDGATTSFTLVDIDNSMGRSGVPVFMEGSLQKTTTYVLADVIKGEVYYDKFYFNFTGIDDEGNDIAAPINDLSRIDANGKWRRQVRTVQFGTVGSALTTGNGKGYLLIDSNFAPADASLDGWRLEFVEGALGVASTSGTATVQLRRVRAGESDVDMLSTLLTFAQDAEYADTGDAVVVSDNEDCRVLPGDQVYVDVDSAGTGAQLPLTLTLTFRRW